MIQGKGCWLHSGREFSWPGYPCVEMLIRGRLGSALLDDKALVVLQNSSSRGLVLDIPGFPK